MHAAAAGDIQMQPGDSIHHSPPSPAARPRLFTVLGQTGALVFLCDLVVLTLYVWLISVGTWTHWPTRWYSYDALATSFSRGRLWLDEGLLPPCSPFLILMSPLPARAYLSQDASLYKGRFYLYFGPVPALLLLPAKTCSPGASGTNISSSSVRPASSSSNHFF